MGISLLLHKNEDTYHTVNGIAMNLLINYLLIEKYGILF